MKFRLPHLAVTLSFALGASVLAAGAYAVNPADMRAEQLIFAASFMKEPLALTPNQQVLWQQVNAKSETLLRARKQRRDKLHSVLAASLAGGNADLRELAGGMAQESRTSADEETQLRELWLTVNDALNDQQRAVALKFLVTQLERVEQGDRPPRGDREQGPPGERGGRQKQGPGQGQGGGPPRF